MANREHSDASRTPIVFGEVLFDRFPDGAEVLGGAPFNVAWHLQGFGAAPLFVSRIGADAQGARVRAAMEEWGLSTAALQTDSALPTGLVDVTLPAGEPRFEILADRAYDAIDAAALAAPADAALVCHGTLALRSEATRRALQQLCTMTGAPRFCDLNLRPPWDADDVLAWSVARAFWLKLNEAELERVCGAPCADRDACVDAARALCGARDLRTVLITRGGEGALAVTHDGGVYEAAAAPADEFVDSVGAGDAFTAVTILGVLRGWAPADSLRRAVAFAARICAQRGATAPDRALYASFVEDAAREERDG